MDENAPEAPGRLQRLAARLFPMDSVGSGGPLSRVVWRHASLLPAILVLGLLASLVEGFGIGMLIPLVGFIAGTGVPAAAPRAIRLAVDWARDGGDAGTTLSLGAVIIVLMLIKGIVQVANAALIAKVDSQAGHDIRAAISRHLLALDYRFYLEHDSSRLVKILTIDAWYGMETVKAHLDTLIALTTILVFAIFLLWLDWKLFLMVLIAVGIIRAAHFLLEARARRLGYLATDINDRLGAQMLVVINAAKPIRIYGQQEAEQKRFETASDEIRRVIEQVESASALAKPLVEFLFVLVFMAIILANTRLGGSIAVVSAFLVLLYRAQPYLSMLAQARVCIASRQGSLRELEWLLSQAPARNLAARARSPLASLDKPIAFRNVSYRYANGTLGLNDVSFVIRPDTTTALIGRSGSGKSTVVNLLCRLLQPSSGEILLGELPAEQFALSDWLGRIALAGQDIELISGSVAFNIAYGEPGASRARIEAAARAASAHEFIVKIPGGYDASVGEEGVSLSSGQRQRIGIARALLRKPDLLILDEATSAVDAIAENEIMRLLGNRSHYKAAIVISHRRSTLLACSDGIVLENGSLKEAGPLAHLPYFGDMLGD